MKTIIRIATFGIAWGIIEVVVGGALHMTRIPYVGLIMAPIGFSILYIALRSGVKPSRLLCISIVAAGLKFASAPIFSVPLLSRGVVNPAMAIAMQGLTFSMIAYLWPRRRRIHALHTLRRDRLG